MPDRYLTFVDTPLQAEAAEGVLANDTDVDGPLLTVDLVVAPLHGTLDLRPDGSFIYQPQTGFAGNDSFSYRLDDGTLAAETTRVAIGVRREAVVISEVMASNIDTLTTRIRAAADVPFESEPETPDWFEIANLTGAPIDLGNFTVTDDPEATAKWRFPAGTIVPANGHLVLFASGRDLTDVALDELGLLHTNFGLDIAGEYLGLL